MTKSNKGILSVLISVPVPVPVDPARGGDAVGSVWKPASYTIIGTLLLHGLISINIGAENS